MCISNDKLISALFSLQCPGVEYSIRSTLLEKESEYADMCKLLQDRSDEVGRLNKQLQHSREREALLTTRISDLEKLVSTALALTHAMN